MRNWIEVAIKLGVYTVGEGEGNCIYRIRDLDLIWKCRFTSCLMEFPYIPGTLVRWYYDDCRRSWCLHFNGGPEYIDFKIEKVVKVVKVSKSSGIKAMYYPNLDVTATCKEPYYWEILGVFDS